MINREGSFGFGHLLDVTTEKMKQSHKNTAAAYFWTNSYD